MNVPFPIRCYTCNLPIAGKWLPYLEMTAKERKKDGRITNDPEYLTNTTIKTAEGRVMDELGLQRECCRRHFLTHPVLPS